MKISLFIKVKNVVHLKNMKKVVLLRLVVMVAKLTRESSSLILDALRPRYAGIEAGFIVSSRQEVNR